MRSWNELDRGRMDRASQGRQAPGVRGNPRCLHRPDRDAIGPRPTPARWSRAMRSSSSTHASYQHLPHRSRVQLPAADPRLEDSLSIFDRDDREVLPEEEIENSDDRQRLGRLQAASTGPRARLRTHARRGVASRSTRALGAERARSVGLAERQLPLSRRAAGRCLPRQLLAAQVRRAPGGAAEVAAARRRQERRLPLRAGPARGTRRLATR